LAKTIRENILSKERKVLVDRRPEILDINPKNWLKPYQKNTVWYMLKMGLFYHIIGLILMYLGSSLVTSVISDYTAPQIPVSISLAITAGFFEEAVFFGIPFYLSGNPLIMLGSGVVWSAAHLFNTGVVSIETLAYGGFLFSVPHIFFSLRTWASGKGWFAIVFHSGWNFAFLMMYCGMGLRECSVINEGIFDALNIIMAITTVFMVYLAYLKQVKKKSINRFLYLLPVVVLLVGLFFLLEEEIRFLS
jgi:hypothetical protein